MLQIWNKYSICRPACQGREQSAAKIRRPSQSCCLRSDSRRKGFLFFQLTERRDFAIIIKLYMDKEHPFYQQLFHVSRLICDIQIVNLPWKHTWRCIEAVVTRTTRNPSGCFAGCLHITRGNVNFDVLTGFKACLNDAFSNNILTATVPSFKADLRYTNRKFAMKIYLEMYRSGRNENDSKSFCP